MNIQLLQQQVKELQVSGKKTEAALKSVGHWHPKTQTLQQTGQKALRASVKTLVPLDELGGQAWETAAMETWSEASRSDGRVSLFA